VGPPSLHLPEQHFNQLIILMEFIQGKLFVSPGIIKKGKAIPVTDLGIP
jgi:hypothetical protein